MASARRARRSRVADRRTMTPILLPVAGTDTAVTRCASEYFRMFREGPGKPTHVAIADSIHQSRNQVGKLLAAAQEEGILRLSLHLPEDDLLARSVEQTRNLWEVVVVNANADWTNQDSVRAALAPVAIQYLQSLLEALVKSDPHIKRIRIGVDGGLTLAQAVNDAPRLLVPPVRYEIVPLVFGPVLGSEFTAQGVARVLKSKLGPGCREVCILDGFKIESVARTRTAADRILRQISIGIGDPEVTRGLDVVVVAIGSRTAGLRAREGEQLRLSKEQRDAHFGDVCNLAFDRNGAEVDALNWDRASLVSLRELHELSASGTTFVVGVAGGSAKLDAINTVIDRGYINALITDRRTADALAADSASPIKRSLRTNVRREPIERAKAAPPASSGGLR